MATQLDPNTDTLDGEIDDDEAYDLTDAEPEGEEPDDDENEGADDAGDDDSQDEGDDVVTFGGEEQEGEAETPAIRQLREALKDTKRRLREAEARVAPIEEEELGPEPDPDDYWDNPEGLKQALREYDRKEANNETRKSERQQAQQVMQERWDTKRNAFETNWSDLRYSTKDAARAKIEDTFNDAEQAMLITASKGNAAFLVALANNPERLDQLKKIAAVDPADFLVEAALMAKETNVTKRSPTTQPEQQHRGASGGGGARGDQKLARLEAEAEKTGDYTNLVKYRSNLKKDKR